jgi:asparagine synthase (glutamine-hydrolysing)
VTDEMCGIAGYLGYHNRLLLARMAARLAHRGPDGEGLWSDPEGGVGLAHRRLAVIDLSDAASQPMSSCGGRYYVSFNGEIYNYRELGAELCARGHVFNRNSDTAVLGPLWDLYGADMLRRLNGIFVFALWDRRERTLFIARDAQGVKPLYYSRVGDGGLIFASELKALLACDGLDRTIDHAAISSYLTNLWSPGEATPFCAVSKLPPGHVLTANADRFEVRAWYPRQLVSATPRSGSEPSITRRTEELVRLFDACVSDQCVSDVPLGAFLSGGVDSSAIVASMVATGHRPINTYCVGFRGPGMAEEGFGEDLPFAQEVAREIGVPLTPILVEQPTVGAVESLVYMLDEPQADLAPLYVSAIAQAARADGIKVLMSGAGGDDIFSGYRRHRSAVLLAKLGVTGGDLLRHVLPLVSALAPGSVGRRFAKLAYVFGGDAETFLLRSFEFNRRAEAIACLSAEYRATLAASDDASWLEQALRRSRGQPLLERMLDLELHGFLPDHNLNYTDKASMAHGVEVRVPFLDGRLIGHVRSIPWGLKTKGLAEKWLLKRAMASRLPASVLKRKKTGFGAPVRSWIAGPMRAMVEDLASSRRMRERGVFDVAAVRKLIDDTLAGERDGAYLLLAIVMIELWMQRFVDFERSDLARARH